MELPAGLASFVETSVFVLAPTFSESVIKVIQMSQTTELEADSGPGELIWQVYGDFRPSANYCEPNKHRWQ